jgi:hypothetical protein
VELVSRHGVSVAVHSMLLRARCARTDTLALLWEQRVGGGAAQPARVRLRVDVDAGVAALRVAVGYVGCSPSISCLLAMLKQRRVWRSFAHCNRALHCCCFIAFNVWSSQT